MTEHRTKNCEVCRQTFSVDPRVGARQRVCEQRRCQSERKRRYLTQWIAEDHDYYSRRYSEYLKAWLAAHPDYQKRYRAAQGQRARQVRRDKQVELNPCHTEARFSAAPPTDIQVQITFRIHTPYGVAHDIQVQLNP